MIRLTISFPDDQHGWLQSEASRSGLSMTAVVQACVEDARVRGVRVEPQPGARVADRP